MGTSNARTRWLTYEEAKELLKCATPEWLGRVMIFALHTGMRRGEILDIKWSSVEILDNLGNSDTIVQVDDEVCLNNNQIAFKFKYGSV